MNTDELLQVFVTSTIGAPLVAMVVLGLLSLTRHANERLTAYISAASLLTSLISLGCAVVVLAQADSGRRVIDLGRWFQVGELTFHLRLLVDPLSLVFASLIVGVCGVVAAFSRRYLHRDHGYQRFFVLLLAFAVGMLLVALADTIELLFTGWELIGLSSALLVAYFHERPEPVRNAMQVFIVYRISDASMLGAAVLLHHLLGTGDFSTLSSPAASLSTGEATLVGSLLLIAAAGKCGVLPFSGWLPRAMEGPTPSSAVFYGALSVHAGAYLLLRAAPILDRAPVVAVAVGTLGLLTALFATIVGRAQSDIKSALALASLTQIGLIWFEIALGLQTLAMVHIVGHACLRLLQVLRSPSLLHDLHELTNALGGHIGRSGAHLERIFSPRARRWLYRFALERGYIDALFWRFFVAPFARVLRALDAVDRRLCDRIAPEPTPPAAPPKEAPHG